MSNQDLEKPKTKKKITTRLNSFNAKLGDDVKSLMQYMSQIEVFNTIKGPSNTHIVCTIGPACKHHDVLVAMIESGMNIARLNFSHGDHEYHKEVIKLIRDAANEYLPVPVAIAVDTKGPEIRTGFTEDNELITLETGSTVFLTHDEKFRDMCTPEKVYVDYKSLTKGIKIGQKILIADGTTVLKVNRLTFEDELECIVMCGSSFGSRKNVSIPGVPTDLPSLAEKDIEDIKFAMDNELDMIFASFIRNVENVEEIREILKTTEHGKKMKIISKIENFEGVHNIDAIIKASDGIMVARGDLGMDLPLSKVVAAQKKIIAQCNLANKPVICATQMMESMLQNRRPTRAEVSDIGNAVVDGADCVMLSGETANGKFPIIAVKQMRSVCRDTEDILFSRISYESIKNSKLSMSHSEAIAMASVSVSFKIAADAIIVLSISGRSAQLISHYMPKCPVVAITRDEVVARQLLLCKGVFPHIYLPKPLEDWHADVEERLKFGIIMGRRLGFIQTESTVVFICGWQKGSGFSNTLRIITVGEDDTIRGIATQPTLDSMNHLNI